jgi:hypothetical protein
VQKHRRGLRSLAFCAQSSAEDRLVHAVTLQKDRRKRTDQHKYTNCGLNFNFFVVPLLTISRLAQSVQCLTTDWTAGVRSPQRQRIFPLPSASRPALGPTQPPVQWVPGALCPGVKRGRGVMLTTHPLLVPRLRNSRSYTSSPKCASMERNGTSLPIFITFIRFVGCKCRLLREL